jgi:hypothetical protein
MQIMLTTCVLKQILQAILLPEDVTTRTHGKKCVVLPHNFGTQQLTLGVTTILMHSLDATRVIWMICTGGVRKVGSVTA